MVEEGLEKLGEEYLLRITGAGYITKDNICEKPTNHNPPLGDVQVYVHPQVLGKGNKIVQHGFSCDLATRPTKATLKISVWPEWNFQWIGNNLNVLKHYPADYVKAREDDLSISDPSIRKGIENLQ